MDYFYAAPLPGLLEKYFNLAIPHGRCTSSLGDLPSGRSKFQRLHSSRCCAFSLSFRYPSSIIQSMRICLDLPLPLFPSILPSIISLGRELPLRICPIQFFCLVLIIGYPLKIFFLPLFSILLYSFCVLSNHF